MKLFINQEETFLQKNGAKNFNYPTKIINKILIPINIHPTITIIHATLFVAEKRIRNNVSIDKKPIGSARASIDFSPFNPKI